MRTLIVLLACLVATTSGVVAQGNTLEEVIRKARATVGAESELDALHAITFRGKFYDHDDKLISELVLHVKKPNSFRMESHYPTYIHIEAVNSDEGYIHMKSTTGERDDLVRVMPYADVVSRWNTARENLYFFQGPNTVFGGQIDYQGVTIKRNKPAHKIAFIYPSGNEFIRYFDRDTGHLLATYVSNLEVEIIESGDIIAGGLNFPKTISNISEDGYLLSRLEFESIEVNPDLDASLFNLPEVLPFGLRMDE